MNKLNHFMLRTLGVLALLVLVTCCRSTGVDNNNLGSVVKGQILDTYRQPLSGAIVKSKGERIAVSDKEGSIQISREYLKEGALLIIEKEGYVTQYKTLKANSVLSFILKERSKSVVINSERGGVVEFGEGGSLKIPRDVFRIKGQPFNGKVNIQATYIDVTNEREIVSAPGTFVAENGSDGLYPLTSFGIVEIIARDAESNTPLTLAKGRELEIAYPVRTENTPDRVNLYELNVETGYWLERGYLQLVGQTQNNETKTKKSL